MYLLAWVQVEDEVRIGTTPLRWIVPKHLAELRTTTAYYQSVNIDDIHGYSFVSLRDSYALTHTH